MTRKRIKVVVAVLAAAAVAVPAAAAFTQPQPPPTYVWNGHRYVKRPTTMRVGRYRVRYINWSSAAWGWGGAGGVGIVDGTPPSWRDWVTLDAPMPCHAGPNSGRIVRAYYTQATLARMPPYVKHPITVRLRVPACF
jgi:hypothetical protein